MLWLGISVSHSDELSRYALSVSEGPVTSGDEIADHQVIIRGGQVEAVVVPLEEYRALKALEQREAELYWAVHEARYPSRPGSPGSWCDQLPLPLLARVRTQQLTQPGPHADQ